MSAILRAAAAAIQAVLKFLDAILATVFRLFGRPAPSFARRLPDLSVRPDDVEDEFHNTYSKTLTSQLVIGSDVGLTIHKYASATEPQTRASVDLSCLRIETIDWLMGLSEKNLRQLADAGPKVCALAASGNRCGIVGLPVPKDSTAPVIDKEEAVRDLFVGRVRDNNRRRRDTPYRQQIA